MNWLAHLLLSEPTPAFRIGNLLPDLVSMPALAGLSAEFQAGIRQHRLIDAYTDSHPIVRRSVLRLGPEFRRFGGILVDMFYDHFLSREWSTFSSRSLPDFTGEIYSSFDTHWAEIPAEAHPPLQGMRRYNWLCSYGDLDNLTLTLKRISQRFRRPVDLASSMSVFEKEYAAFRSDFAEYFPQLQGHVGSRRPVS